MWLRALAVTAALAMALGVNVSAVAQGGAPSGADKPTLELSVEQRQLIFTSITSRTHKSTAAPANFLPALGATVPAGVEVLPIPDTVLEVVPKLRGYVCALIANQALIIDPQSRRVIEVIGTSGEPRKPAPS
jgi:hypothetical protein